MGLEDDEQNMGICPKGCYPLNPSSPKNSLDFHTATQPMELGGGRQLFKKRWPCLSHISIPENASKSKDWCSTKNGSFEWTEEQKNPTILSGVFHLRLRPPYIFLWCRAGSASRAISDAFCGFLFFHRHKTPYFLNDRWPTGRQTERRNGGTARFPRLIREITTALALRAFSMTSKVFFVEWCFFGLSIILVLDWAFKKNILDLALVDAELVINLVDFLF